MDLHDLKMWIFHEIISYTSAVKGSIVSQVHCNICVPKEGGSGRGYTAKVVFVASVLTCTAFEAAQETNQKGGGVKGSLVKYLK